ncbi:unnamed protein product [Pleuronectes platessa]|uniref:Uncharacterized protein n=1 Tax=Pleuronectes platessa TaxID=8262 RepID=A0A9N7YEF1_PLEPL|nr:unnamed protein product [Pleuronectes platessa]
MSHPHWSGFGLSRHVIRRDAARGNHEEKCRIPWMMMSHDERRFSKSTASPSDKDPQSFDHQSTVQADVQAVFPFPWSKTSCRPQANTPV